ncbi:MAG: hypothetical protein NT013_03705 [Planctomycetia bacterium]|nr:hypothetical protein [Planctomycetia bacterium]
MQQPHTELWQRLQGFEFDDPAAESQFSARLARENHWSRKFARRVLEEYRRFLFLSVAAGHPVAPSEAVDQAWHLHLIYSESYWDEMCGRVLRRSLHHWPSKGGADEQSQLGSWYSQTLASYERLFGEKPPADMWPRTNGMQPTAEVMHVDANTFWLIPKVSWPVVSGKLVIVLLIRVSCLVRHSEKWPRLEMGLEIRSRPIWPRSVDSFGDQLLSETPASGQGWLRFH